MDSLVETNSIPSKFTRNLTDEERKVISEILQWESNNGKLPKGSLTTLASSFSVCPRTIARIWKQVKHCLEDGLAVDVSSKIPKNSGCKKIQIDLTKVSEVPLRRRTNIRSLAKALKVSKSTVHRHVKEGSIRSHSNALKPFLSDRNKKQRLFFCLSMLNLPYAVNAIPFYDMFNMVHIDEKWFYMTKEAEKYYLLPEENEPLRTCKSKRFITKVMFLTAVARPRFDTRGNVEFSGKIGIFPLVYKEPAKRTSKNRIAGTLETKPILSVTKEVTRAVLIEKVLPAIQSKWPRYDAMKTIYIQQDNAKPHIDVNDVEFLEAAGKDGFDIRLVCQPPNSPDLNVLDLGFFRAIQSLQHQEAPSTVDELINAVEKSFNEYPEYSLNNVFLTLQSCMIEIMKVGGGNNYKVPHMGKDRLQMEGNLPLTLECDRVIVNPILDQL